MKNHAFFTFQLLKWDKNENFRVMPWKGERDPYKIWLSEIILQQTRVSQGLGYYNEFVNRFPTITLLANANEQEIYKLWEGLGYYSRCKNLIATAKYIADTLGGTFPNNYDNLLKLKGVGPYTAAAIASFAYNIPKAVLDGNVFRVLSRFFGIREPIDSKTGKEVFEKLANELLEKSEPGRYNQSIMDFGANICKPRNPECEICPLQQKCEAYRHNLIELLPIKEKRIKQKERWFLYLLVHDGGEIYIRQRAKGDIWENLHEFILIELPSIKGFSDLKNNKSFRTMFGRGNYKIVKESSIYQQKLTHQIIKTKFIEIKAAKISLPEGYFKVTENAIKKLAFPKVITTFLADKNVSLNLTKGV